MKPLRLTPAIRVQLAAASEPASQASLQWLRDLIAKAHAARRTKRAA